MIDLCIIKKWGNNRLL